MRVKILFFRYTQHSLLCQTVVERRAKTRVRGKITCHEDSRRARVTEKDRLIYSCLNLLITCFNWSAAPPSSPASSKVLDMLPVVTSRNAPTQHLEEALRDDPKEVAAQETKLKFACEQVPFMGYLIIRNQRAGRTERDLGRKRGNGPPPPYHITLSRTVRSTCRFPFNSLPPEKVCFNTCIFLHSCLFGALSKALKQAILCPRI